MSIDDIKKAKRGRPPANKSPVLVRLENAQLAQIDTWRDAQPDKPTRPEAVRRLVDKGLSK